MENKRAINDAQRQSKNPSNRCGSRGFAWWPITYHIRTIHIIKGDRLCAVLIVEGQHDFIIIHEYRIDKAINQPLPLGFMHTLQTKTDQRIQAGEFPGIPEQHVYRGRVYSGFVVDMVRDSMGGFVEVYTAFVDDAYCRYRENRELNKYRLLPSVDRRDIDY